MNRRIKRMLGGREGKRGKEESEKRERGREDRIKTFIRSGAEKSACIQRTPV